MNIELQLKEIWNNKLFQHLPEQIQERGFVYAENTSPKDILITGINPSFRNDAGKESHGFDFSNTMMETKWDNYWGTLKKMLFDELENVDLREKCAYLDILYFREKEQAFLNKKLLKTQAGVHFVAAQINLTQHIIEEVIKPKVIVIKNKGSQVFWGKEANRNIYWMGYMFEPVEELYCGDLYKIVGLYDSKERVAFEINETNLKNTLVLFSHHINQYTQKEKRIKAKTLNDILERYNH